jgi:hypothetical protein
MLQTAEYSGAPHREVEAQNKLEKLVKDQSAKISALKDEIRGLIAKPVSHSAGMVGAGRY